MQYRRLGSTGLPISALSFGAWVTFGDQIPRDEARNLVAAAWDHGVNFFDNAEGYANGRAEQVMGDVIADLRLPRDGFCVSSKVFFGSAKDPRPTQRGLSRKHVTDACHAALKRLRVDYLDLYYCHRPDPDAPIAETVHAMDTLVRQGKILYWGTSEWSAVQIQQALDIAEARNLQGPSMEQPQYNLLHRERVEVEYAPLYAGAGLGTGIQRRWRRACSPASTTRAFRPMHGWGGKAWSGCRTWCWGPTPGPAWARCGASARWHARWATPRPRWPSPGACATRTFPA